LERPSQARRSLSECRSIKAMRVVSFISSSSSKHTSVCPVSTLVEGTGLEESLLSLARTSISSMKHFNRPLDSAIVSSAKLSRVQLGHPASWNDYECWMATLHLREARFSRFGKFVRGFSAIARKRALNATSDDSSLLSPLLFLPEMKLV